MASGGTSESPEVMDRQTRGRLRGKLKAGRNQPELPQGARAELLSEARSPGIVAGCLCSFSGLSLGGSVSHTCTEARLPRHPTLGDDRLFPVMSTLQALPALTNATGGSAVRQLRFHPGPPTSQGRLQGPRCGFTPQCESSPASGAKEVTSQGAAATHSPEACHPGLKTQATGRDHAAF